MIQKNHDDTDLDCEQGCQFYGRYQGAEVKLERTYRHKAKTEKQHEEQYAAAADCPSLRVSKIISA